MMFYILAYKEVWVNVLHISKSNFSEVLYNSYICEQVIKSVYHILTITAPTAYILKFKTFGTMKGWCNPPRLYKQRLSFPADQITFDNPHRFSYNN